MEEALPWKDAQIKTSTLREKNQMSQWQRAAAESHCV